MFLELSMNKPYEKLCKINKEPTKDYKKNYPYISSFKFSSLKYNLLHTKRDNQGETRY